MIFQLGQFILDVDVEQTRLCYEKQKLIIDDCGCEGCKNYYLAYEFFPDTVKALFRKLGINGKKPYDAYVNCHEREEKQCFYGGMYFLCGTVKHVMPTFHDSIFFEIEKGYSVSFDTGDRIKDSSYFTYPTVVMEIAFHIPWVL